MTIEVEREMDGIFYYVSVAVSLTGDDIDAHVAEDVPELEITGHERSTGQAIRKATGALAFVQGDEIDLDEKETSRALKAIEAARNAQRSSDLASTPNTGLTTLRGPVAAGSNVEPSRPVGVHALACSQFQPRRAADIQQNLYPRALSSGAPSLHRLTAAATNQQPALSTKAHAKHQRDGAIGIWKVDCIAGRQP